MRTIISGCLFTFMLACAGCSADVADEAVQRDAEKQTSPDSAAEPGQPDTEGGSPDAGPQQSAPASGELAKIQQELRQHALPAIRITPLKVPPATPWQSRFGGVPYWPKSQPLPTTPEGKPLHLLAQINFSEAPHIPEYPAEGILQIFIADNDVYGLEFRSEERTQAEINRNPNGYKVIYHAEPEMDATKLLTEAPTPESFPVTGTYSLQFEKTQDPLSISDVRFSRLIKGSSELPDEVWDKLSRDYSGGGSKICGHAFFTQNDPRAKAKGEVAQGEWILLLQIDSEFKEGISINWGDSGVGNVFIRPADLAKKDFSNVWYNWDCY
ncbi:MAG: DUF1963 domain-containing protein [Planctomycetaceae bacterium]|nr:DUF1963 domain-containing protein [Planctomycetaceae bacterium]